MARYFLIGKNGGALKFGKLRLTFQVEEFSLNFLSILIHPFGYY